MSLNTEWQSRKEQATARGVGVLSQVYAARAENAEIWDVEGKRYIDFAGGIGVLNTGHRHPKVVAAVASQLGRFTHTCFQVMPYPGYVELAEQLNRLTPGGFRKKPHFFSPAPKPIRNGGRMAGPPPARGATTPSPGRFTGGRRMRL